MAEELSFADVLTNEMKETMGTIRNETRQMFANKRPYRAMKVSESERIANYLATPPEVHEQLRTSFGDEQYNKYVSDMESLIDKFKGV